ncbi:MAG: hypothetical protein LBG09_03635 [Puniceicoccales bacterium]|nr:hypothetical protein [Puniceicoccales bacterium]
MRKWVPIVGIFLLPAAAAGSNLYDFSLPLFDKYGQKICNIYGQKADLSNDEIFNVSNISIQILPQNKNTPNCSVRSDQANINTQQNSASGSGSISILHEQFYVTGRDWETSENCKKFTFKKNVQVLFPKNKSSEKFGPFEKL